MWGKTIICLNQLLISLQFASLYSGFLPPRVFTFSKEKSLQLFKEMVEFSGIIMSLKRIFEISKEYDLISNEYTTGFNIILNEGLPFYLEEISRTKDINITTVNTFLKILASYPDSLVIRKAGKNAAFELLENARRIIEQGGISSKQGWDLIHKLDEDLQKENGKMNPGTTADLIAGVIFCALILGIRF